MNNLSTNFYNSIDVREMSCDTLSIVIFEKCSISADIHMERDRIGIPCNTFTNQDAVLAFENVSRFVATHRFRYTVYCF